MERGGMSVNVKSHIGEKTTCAVGILFIILATGTTGSSTTTSTSTGTTTPLTATSKCIGTSSPTQYILGVQLFSDQNCAVENGECFTLCSVNVDSFFNFSQAKTLDSVE